MIFNDSTKTLYDKYMTFHQIMLEDHSAEEIAGTVIVQALSFYKTILTEEGYEQMIKTIYDTRHQVKQFKE